MKRRRVPALCLWFTVWAAMPSEAGTVTGVFDLAEGHAGRRELAFAVHAPGLIEVQVECDTPGVELFAMLHHNASTAQNAQGAGVIRYEFTASPQQVAQAREWAVRVQAVTPGQQAAGRITVTFPDGAAQPAHELDGWLVAHPAVARQMRWRDVSGMNAYSAWPRAVQERLWRFFDLTRAGQPPALPDPPRNAWVYGAGDVATAVHTLFTQEDARDLYLATVAHSLVLEVDRRVPWSLADLNEEGLEALFSSASMLWWNEPRQGYESNSHSHGWAVPCPPQTAWRFLQEKQLLRGTRLETIVALLGWCKGLVHFAGGATPDNFEDYWGYRGDMPVSRVLAGTRYSGEEFRNIEGYGDVRHYTAGCHGTVGLLVSVLRAANIPAKYRSAGDENVSHATILFLSEDKALTHGDDPYSQTAVRGSPEELLIDLATYNAWLGPLAQNPARNIGRQPQVIALRHLAPFVLRAHARDKANSTPRAQGEVFTIFKDAFTMQELEAARLWERLDAELAGEAPAAPKATPVADASPAVMRTKDDAATQEQRAKEAAAASPAGMHGIALEAETLRPQVTGGQWQEQPMAGFTTGKWSGDKQLWWTGGKTDDVLTLTFAVKTPGVYRIAAAFTRAPDYGIISIAVDGAVTKLQNLDLYDPQVTRSDALPLGEFKLDAGDHRLTFRITGSNTAAAPSLMVGLDEVRFESVK